MGSKIKDRDGATKGGVVVQRGVLKERLIVLFVVGGLAFSYPILKLFSVEGSVFGWPVLYVYIFAAWAGVILALAWIARSARRGRN